MARRPALMRERLFMTEIHLDKIDLMIIRILQTQGRISILELADKVGLSPTPCGRRLKALEDRGVIRHYAAVVDYSLIGLTIEAVIYVRLERQHGEHVAVFIDHINRLPEIYECLLVTGEYDYILRVRTHSPDTLKEFIINKLTTIPCIAQTVSMLVLEDRKMSETIALDALVKT